MCDVGSVGVRCGGWCEFVCMATYVNVCMLVYVSCICLYVLDAVFVYACHCLYACAFCTFVQVRCVHVCMCGVYMRVYVYMSV